MPPSVALVSDAQIFCLGPTVAIDGDGYMVSVNVALAGRHMPLSMTVIVRVIMPPIELSLGPKVYVGVAVVLPAVNVPSPVVVQAIFPLAAVYPGMV